MSRTRENTGYMVYIVAYLDTKIEFRVRVRESVYAQTVIYLSNVSSPTQRPTCQIFSSYCFELKEIVSDQMCAFTLAELLQESHHHFQMPPFVGNKKIMYSHSQVTLH